MIFTFQKLSSSVFFVMCNFTMINFGVGLFPFLQWAFNESCYWEFKSFSSEKLPHFIALMIFCPLFSLLLYKTPISSYWISWTHFLIFLFLIALTPLLVYVTFFQYYLSTLNFFGYVPFLISKKIFSF